MPDPRPLRGGIIGCGFFAQFHIEAWRRMPSVELVAACDLDPARAQAAAPRAYTDPERMLASERLDFIDIATRPETHLDIVRLAAAHRLPAICQKPMAPTWDDAVAIANTAATAGARLMIHENWRWQPWYRAARDLLTRGAIGAPIGYRFRTVKRDGMGPEPFPDQPYFRRMPRLLIYETIVHHLDTARFLFGPIQSVFARTRRNNPIIAGEDQASLLLTHTSDLFGSIDGHRMLDPHPPGVALGEAWLEGDQGQLYLAPTGDIYQEGRCIWQNAVPEGYRGDSVRATQQHFVDCLQSGAEFETSAREYLKTVAAVEAAYRSAASTQAVEPSVR